MTMHRSNMSHKRWTNQEEQFLIDRYCDFTNKELANIMKRPYYSIQTRAIGLGLTKAKRSTQKSKLKVVINEEPIQVKRLVRRYEPSSISRLNEVCNLKIKLT